RGQTFTGIVTGSADLELLQQTFLLDIAVERAGEGAAEARQVGTAVALGNVVGETQQVLVEAVVPLHGHFHADPVIALNVEVEHRVDRSEEHTSELQSRENLVCR